MARQLQIRQIDTRDEQYQSYGCEQERENSSDRRGHLIGKPDHLGVKLGVRPRPASGNRLDFAVDAFKRRSGARAADHLKAEVSEIERPRKARRQPGIGDALRKREFIPGDADNGEGPRVQCELLSDRLPGRRFVA